MMQRHGKRFDPYDIDERWVRMYLGMTASPLRGPLTSHPR